MPSAHDFEKNSPKMAAYLSSWERQISLMPWWLQLDKISYILKFEADRRAFMITINSFGTELSKDDRVKLFPTCGKLNPEGLAVLAKADEYDQVKAVAEYYAVSHGCFRENSPCIHEYGIYRKSCWSVMC